MKLLESKPATRATLIGTSLLTAGAILFGVNALSGNNNSGDARGEKISAEESTTTVVDQSTTTTPGPTSSTSTTIEITVSTNPSNDALDGRVGALESEVSNLDERVDTIESTTTTVPSTTTTSWWNPSDLSPGDYEKACNTSPGERPEWCYKPAPPG